MDNNLHKLLLNLEQRITRLEDILATVNSTTPTCGSIERKKEPTQNDEWLSIPPNEKGFSDDLEPGKPCPTCGKPVGLTPAERQRRYRERKRDEV